MTLHVDLVETRWSAGFQECVAKVIAHTNGLQIKGAEAHWERLIRDALADAGADDDLGKALSVLSAHFKSDYAHATEPHDDDQCPFAHGQRIPFDAGQVTEPQPARAG